MPGQSCPGLVSVGFPVAVHVAGLGFGYLSAVQTVQESMGDLGDHGAVWNGLSHAVDRALREHEDMSEHTCREHKK